MRKKVMLLMVVLMVVGLLGFFSGIGLRWFVRNVYGQETATEKSERVLRELDEHYKKLEERLAEEHNQIMEYHEKKWQETMREAEETANTCERNRVNLSKVHIGLTAKKAKTLFEGVEINRTVVKGLTFEQWVVFTGINVDGRQPHVYLYFENGILTAWQD